MSLIMNNNQESDDEFWNILFRSFAESNPKDMFYPEISRPIMVMSTSMSIDAPAEPQKFLEDKVKQIAQEHVADEVEDYLSIDEFIENSTKAMDKGKQVDEDAEPENSKSLYKRPRRTGPRSKVEKRRRIDIRNKIETLRQMLKCPEKQDVVSSLETIVHNIKEMKVYVESWQSHFAVTMMPYGMGMEFPSAWHYPYRSPNFIMSFNAFPQGQSSGYEIVPHNTKGKTNEPESSKPM